jgi:hypothetical protein
MPNIQFSYPFSEAEYETMLLAQDQTNLKRLLITLHFVIWRERYTSPIFREEYKNTMELQIENYAILEVVYIAATSCFSFIFDLYLHINK